VLFGCYAVGEPTELGAINDQHGPTVHDIDVGLPSEQIFEYNETAMSAALMVTSIALRLPQAPHRQPVCPLPHPDRMPGDLATAGLRPGAGDLRDHSWGRCRRSPRTGCC